MIKPEPTILGPDEVAVVHTKDKGYKFLKSDTFEDDREVPDEVAILVAATLRPTNNKDFYQEMLECLPWLAANEGVLGFATRRTASALMKAANGKPASHLDEGEAAQISRQPSGRARRNRIQISGAG